MKLIATAITTLALSLPIATNTCLAESDTPAEQFATLLKDFGSVSGGMRQAKTDGERKDIVERLSRYAPKFLDLAEKYPTDPVALQSLRQAVQVVGTTDSAAQIAWETNGSDFPTDITDDSASRTVTLLTRDHLLSDRLGPVCDRMRYRYRMEYESFLNTALEKNPYRNVQAVACLSLAQFLNDRLSMLELANDRPELAERYEAVFGQDYLPGLQRRGRAQLTHQIETLFERVVDEYSDVTIGDSTAGAMAESGLFDIRHLTRGKMAPEIAGRDQNGTEFKLSDYRGKVVLLYFWSEY